MTKKKQTNQARLQKRLSEVAENIAIMKKYIPGGSFGTVERMLFTMHEDLSKCYAILLDAQKDRDQKTLPAMAENKPKKKTKKGRK
jgi:hypothetical protein